MFGKVCMLVLFALANSGARVVPPNQVVTMTLTGTVVVTCIDGMPYIDSGQDHVAVVKCRR